MRPVTKMKKQTAPLIYMQLLLFIAIILLAQYQLFTFAFISIFCFILYLMIKSEPNRLFIWTAAAYLLGYVFYLYGDRLTEELPFSFSTIMIVKRFLLLFPILFIYYVSKKFGKRANDFYGLPNWKEKISFPFIWKGFHTVSIKTFLMIALSINVIAFIPLILKENMVLSLSFLTFLILFSAINAIIEEALWRGLLLTRMKDLAGEKAAVIFSGLAFGLSHLALGYSLPICLGFAAGGVFYAGITVRSRSLFPAMIWHFFYNGLMIVSGIIPYPG